MCASEHNLSIDITVFKKPHLYILTSPKTKIHEFLDLLFPENILMAK
jgi:hypothetical protein